MKRLIVMFIIFFIGCVPALAGASKAAEESAAPERGKYLAGRGIIIPPEEIYIDSYIGYIDYNYPKPDDDFGVTLYAGHRQVSSRGQEEVLQIGIQGRELDFEELPPMNLAFVIDKSGSMGDLDKMEWVKESFYIFIEKVRDIDYVSLIVFDSGARVVFPSTVMNTAEKREKFKRSVRSIQPGGGTNLVKGLELGYKEVLSNYRSEYTNRVLFLTDGIGESGGIIEMARVYRRMGINVSTIGVGRDFDLHLMRELGQKGGGSSRFISGREEMEETFGSELDRMVVPIAYDLDMELEFLQDVRILGTWGYDHRIQGRTVHYYLPTLHHRDYETILASVRIPPLRAAGESNLLRFSLTYNDAWGNRRSAGPYYLKINFVDMEYPVAGFSNGMVLQSGTMLNFATALQEIGRLYYSQQVQRALDLTVKTQKELKNARLRLDDLGFDDEIEILDNYIKIFGGDLVMSDSETYRIRMEEEIAPPVRERPLQEQLENLFREITLDLGSRGLGTIAVSGFTAGDGRSPNLVTLLNEMARFEISKVAGVTVIERDNIDMILEEQKLALSDLMDTTNAIEIGKLLTANHMLTGSVIEMPDSVVIFGRIINVETAEIESVAQVIVPRNGEVTALV
jgi:Mg-chelatase subunit ChlD